MPDAPRGAPEGEIRELFEGPKPEPRTAREVATETGYPLETVSDRLDALVERSVLRTKEVGDGEQVWWAPPREERDSNGPEPSDSKRAPVETSVDAPDDAPVDTPDSVTAVATDNPPDGRQTPAARERLLAQHRQLAKLATRINVTDDLDGILRLITEEARALVGAHQSVTSRTINQNWEQAINAVSLSDTYAEYRDYDNPPDGSGIYALVCERNEPMRMTQAELESHPAWRAFGDDADDHPPMDGWLAVPIVGSDGQNIGIVQLSDKYRGEFTEADEAILVQLANVASAAIENARLYDELRESEERYRTLFESMTEGYCVVAKVDVAPEEPIDFRYVEANPAFENHSGFQDVVGKTVREVVPAEPQKWVDIYESVVQTGDVVTFESDIGPHGPVLQCRAFPIGDASNVQAGVTVQDVSERVDRERRLRESNERLEQFAYAASHDLQEPLRMVSSYMQLLERRYGDGLDADAEEFLEYAIDGADRMRAMVDGLLEYSRVETQGEPFEPVDLDDVVGDAREDLQVMFEESDAELTVEELPRVEGDASQLRQVFQNLLENAIEYSGDEPPRIHVAAERDGSEWVLSVRDEGIGIDPEHADSIFEVFERLHTHDEHPGTGIGLALCERIVERHGGDIWIDSSPGEGTTFEFTLPTVWTGEQ